MRCLTCGHNMVLMAALPAERQFVHGFEQQTIQCPACGEIEHRFVFKAAVTAAAREMTRLASPTDCINPSLSDNDKQKPVPSANSIDVDNPVLGTDEIGNWARVNNDTDYPILRLNRADAPERTNRSEKPPAQDCRIKVFAPAAKEKSPAGDQGLTKVLRPGPQGNGLVFEGRECRSANGSNASPQRWLRAVEKFRTYKTDLNRRIETGKRSKANSIAPLRTPSRPRPPERFVLDRFDDLWEGLTPDRQNSAELPVPAVSLAPLPRSLSLVVVETRETPGHRRGDKHLSKNDKHLSKKVLEKLYDSLQHMLPSL